jgi:hypothetical protein
MQFLSHRNVQWAGYFGAVKSSIDLYAGRCHRYFLTRDKIPPNLLLKRIAVRGEHDRFEIRRSSPKAQLPESLR